MEILVIAICAYLASGASLVFSDLEADPLHKPMWAQNPSIGRIIFQILLFPYAQAVKNYCLSNDWPRAGLNSIFATIFQVSLLSTYIFGCLALSKLMFSSALLVIASTTVISLIGTPIILPIASLLLTPLLLIVMIPFNILLPRKKTEG